MKKKIILAQGLVFEEEQEKLRLEKLAHEGWLFESVAWGGLGWRLVRGEPQFRQYEFDYLPSDPAERQEYLVLMEASGWHPAFRQDPIVLFWSDEKRTPIHTEASTKLESYAPLARGLSRISLVLGGLLIALLLSGLKGRGIALIFLTGLIGFTMTTMCASGYRIRMQLLKRQVSLQEKLEDRLRKQIITRTAFAHLLLLLSGLYLLMIAYARKPMPVGLWLLIALQVSAGLGLKLICWKQMKELG